MGEIERERETGERKNTRFPPKKQIKVPRSLSMNKF